MLSIGMRGEKALRITDEQRSRHMHIIGASGTGKSRYLEHLIRQDIIAGRGVCVIDPHGTLADDIVRFCASRNVERYRRVHIIEPGDPDWCVGFNPLRVGSEDPMLRVDTMVTACAEVWGGEEMDRTPLLATCLQLVFYALAVRKLTLVEAIELTNAVDSGKVRKRLTDGLPDHVYDSYWRDYRDLRPKEFEERFSSTRRRLLRFLGAPLVRRVVGQRERVLDLRRVMDEGDILIVNLASKDGLSETSARLLGALLTSEFFLCAKARSPDMARRRPFYLYIDECYDYLTGDIERMLDQTRKFGLHVSLAHHRLEQLRKRSPAIYSGVMAGAQTKVVFGGLADEDADILAREIMRDSFNLQRPKHSMDRPVVVGDEVIWLESEGTASGETHGHGSATSASWSESTGLSLGAGEMYHVYQDAPALQTGMQTSFIESAGSGQGGGVSSSEFEAYSTSASRGRHEAIRSRYEVRPTQIHSLEEEVHLAIVRLREQKNRSAIVKLRGTKAKGVYVPDVTPALASRARIVEFRNTALETSEYLSPCVGVDAEIAERHKSFAGPLPEQGEAQFWHDEE